MSVVCKRCGREGDAPPPHRVPFSGQAKDEVLSGICAACWREWEGMEVKVINEYRLNPATREAQEIIGQQMEQFFFGEGAALPPGYVPPQKKA